MKNAILSNFRSYCIYKLNRMVGCFGLNGPLRQYFSLYRAVSQRERERKRRERMNPGRFGPIPVRSGRFGPISGVSRFGPTGAGRFGLVSKVGRFGPI